MKEKKVSIIIPNYNCENYVPECLNSIYNQNYNNIEIIIIDDGSNDSSVSVISECIKGKSNVKLIVQPNMNASIARNKGIEISTGDYLYFLDSDDVLLQDGISKLVENIEISNADLCIGNYVEIDDQYNELFSTNIIEEKVNNPLVLSKFSPVPSNKLYRKDIVVNNNVFFANVNIGQDLNFFLKYLACCKTVACIEERIYKHRIVNNGMTQKVSFKIFDIVKNYEDILKFYDKRKFVQDYNKYIAETQFKHYFWQMNKQVKCKDYRMRRLIVDYFCYNIKKIKFDFSTFSKSSKRDLLIFRFNCIFRFITCSKLYGLIFKKIVNKKNISF